MRSIKCPSCLRHYKYHCLRLFWIFRCGIYILNTTQVTPSGVNRIILVPKSLRTENFIDIGLCRHLSNAPPPHTQKQCSTSRSVLFHPCLWPLITKGSWMHLGESRQASRQPSDASTFSLILVWHCQLAEGWLQWTRWALMTVIDWFRLLLGLC